MRNVHDSPARTRYDCPIGPEYSKIYDDKEMNFLSLSYTPLLIGITGPSKAGKTMVAKHLVTDRGFHYASLSMMLRERARYLGIISPRWEDLRDIALRWRREKGHAILVEDLLKELVQTGVLRTKQAIVIDGILHPAEVEALKRRPNFFLVAIIAGRSLRYRMAENWLSSDKVLSWQDFVKRDRWELGLEPIRTERPPEAPNIGICIQMTPKSNRFVFRGREVELMNSVTDFVQSLSYSFR